MAEDVLREVFLEVNFFPTDQVSFPPCMLLLVWSCIEQQLQMSCVFDCLSILVGM